MGPGSGWYLPTTCGTFLSAAIIQCLISMASMVQVGVILPPTGIMDQAPINGLALKHGIDIGVKCLQPPVQVTTGGITDITLGSDGGPMITAVGCIGCSVPTGKLNPPIKTIFSVLVMTGPGTRDLFLKNSLPMAPITSGFPP